MRSRGHRLLRRLCALSCAAALCGCAQVDIVALAEPELDSGGSGGAPDAGRDAAPPMLDATPPPDAMPPVDTGVDDATVPPPPPPPCPYRTQPADDSGRTVAEVVASGLSRAICTCGGYSGAGALVTLAPPGAGDQVADLGVNGPFDQQLTADIAGSLIVAADDGISIGPGAVLRVVRDLASAGPLEGAEAGVTVGGDAAVAGRIDVFALEIAGTLTQPAGETLQVASPPNLGAVQSGAVVVAPPCGCDDAELLDVAALARDGAMRAPPLVPDTLVERCAEYALDGATVDGLEITASAPAAIYVSGDLNLDMLRIATGPDAEIDLFIEGNVHMTGPVELDPVAAGGPIRLHIGGTGTFELPQGATLHGALYAPSIEIVLSGPLEAQGALFVRRVAASDAVRVRYDPDVFAPP